MNEVYFIFLGGLMFIMCCVSFSIGFKFGKAVREDRQPKLEPVKTVAETVSGIKEQAEQKKASSDFADAFKNVMMYEGEFKEG